MPKGRKKLNKSVLLLIITVLSSMSIGAYLLTNGKISGKQTQIEQVTRYKELNDSLSILDIEIRESKTPELRLLNKERKNLLQAKVESLRNNFVGETLLDGDLPIQTKLPSWLINIKNLIYFVVSVLALFIITLSFLLLKQKRKQKVNLEDLYDQSKLKQSKAQKVEANFSNSNPKEKIENPLSKLSEILEKEREEPQSTPNSAGPSDKISMMDALNQKKSPVSSHEDSVFNFDEAVKNPRSRSEIRKQLHSSETIENLKPLPSKSDELDKIFDWPLDEAPTSPKKSDVYPSTLRDLDNRDKRNSDILKLARRGFTSSEISRRLKTSQDEIEILIKLHREKGV